MRASLGMGSLQTWPTKYRDVPSSWMSPMGPNLVTGVLGGRGEATEERGGYGGVEAELGGRCRGPGTQAQRAGPSRGLSVAPPPSLHVAALWALAC